MKWIDWMIWLTGALFVADLIIIGMAATGRFNPARPNSATAYGYEIAKGLNAVSVASTGAAQNLPVSELKTFLAVSRQTRATRRSFNQFYEDLNKLSRMVDEAARSGSPEWEPIQKAVHDLTRQK